MTEDTPTIAVARRFSRLVLEGDPPPDATLARALDELALAYHDCPEGDPADEDGAPPVENYHERFNRLALRFQLYGHYPVADPLGAADQACMLGNAIDDLADITGDLDEVIWRFEHLGADDAHWHFRFLYEIHWGQHLRELSTYLYARIRRDFHED